MKYTPNYKFNLYEPGDLANLTDGFNNNFEQLDVLLTQLASQLTSANNALSAMQAQITSLDARVKVLEAK